MSDGDALLNMRPEICNDHDDWIRKIRTELRIKIRTITIAEHDQSCF